MNKDTHCLPGRGRANEPPYAYWMGKTAVPARTWEPMPGSLALDASTFLTEGLAIHAARVARYARTLAEQLGLSPEACQEVAVAGLFHDIGKVGIPRILLARDGPLTDKEFAIMRAHTWMGARILRKSSAVVVHRAAQVALLHHEKYDGTGYPFGISAKHIPLSARIVAVADVFDALCSERPYKAAWPIECALDYLETQQGRHRRSGPTTRRT
ncbi:MAG: HD-GYP domain-containing protein [Acidiferrobacterales bacterium]